MTNPTKDLYPEQIRNSLNSAVRKQTLQLKMGKRLEHFIKQDILMVNKGQKYIYIISYLESADENHRDTTTH